MSDAPPTFSVALHHLSPDARRAGITEAEVQLTDVTLPQLRGLLEALAQLAPEVEYPTLPEMRIVGAGQQFLVQVRAGQVRFSSWSVRAGGCELTPTQILAAIAGPEDAPAAPINRPADSDRKQRGRRLWLVALLAFGVIGSNALTAWMLTRPAPDMLPEYHLLEPEPARRLLERVEGVYETGSAEGDRRLSLQCDGTMVWAEYGVGCTIREETLLSAKAAESAGRPALLASNRSLIEVRDPVTLIYFGDTYRRARP